MTPSPTSSVAATMRMTPFSCWFRIGNKRRTVAEKRIGSRLGVFGNQPSGSTSLQSAIFAVGWGTAIEVSGADRIPALHQKSIVRLLEVLWEPAKAERFER
jgi:hypothetical protein